ncbi:serine hydrolase FSH [Aspergillus caelatus]|uniref:Serine hydrolase FSH n=1 Tax=Aspergillus caelatus TaxID=61420 RepID=A0A5N7A7H1_9EURO|nr:serine hydrolase FSH [Aspergillus caelatus]KAE8364490.1 serine hydrolase FSH [Aspergillus caelatus]
MSDSLLPTHSNTLDPASLSCPRILCLHGGGSNARIFRIGCRVLEAQLSNRARLVYADGPFFASPGPLIAGFFTEWGPFRSWLPPDLGVGPGKGQGVKRIYEDPTDADMVIEKIHQSFQKTMDDDDRAGGTGPWVGLLGFSQGAKIVASLLLRQQINLGGSIPLPCFQFGTLVAGSAPLVWLGSTETYQRTRELSVECLLRIPTVHVYGRHDCLIQSSAEWLYQCCLPDSRRVFVWEGDHVMPTRTRDVSAIVEMIVELLEGLANRLF